jgi:hypothetical protein
MLFTPRSRAAAAASHRSRRVAPSCRGGASSLLRLAQPAAPRLPSSQDLGDWLSRAIGVLSPMPARGFAPSEFNPG